MLYPISHKKYLDIIIKALHVNSYMYGSKRYGRLSYYHPIADIMLDRYMTYGVSIYHQKFDIYNNDFIIDVDIRYPEWRTELRSPDIIIRQPVHIWNNNAYMNSTTYENSNPSDIEHNVEYLGDLDEIVSVATILNLSEESIF